MQTEDMSSRRYGQKQTLTVGRSKVDEIKIIRFLLACILLESYKNSGLSDKIELFLCQTSSQSDSQPS